MSVRKNVLKLIVISLLIASILLVPAAAADSAGANGGAAEATESVMANTTSVKAIAAALAIMGVAAAGAVSMAISIGKSNESTARQPEASGNIRTNLMLGLVFIETAIIYALIIAILIIFVL